MSSRVIHFEINAGDPERAMDFYESVFGWEFKEWDGPEDYWVIRTGSKDEPGIDGGLLRRRGELDAVAVIGFVCTVEVSDIDEAVAAVANQGGKLIGPKIPISGTGWMIYCKDTEGNVLGIMEKDPTVE